MTTKGNTGKERRIKLLMLSRIPHHEEAMVTTIAVPNWIIEVVQIYQDDERCKELEHKLRIDMNSAPPFTL